MNIRGIRLVTGEELIAKVTPGANTGDVIIGDPLQVRMSLGEKGAIVCNFLPWTIINEGPIQINASAIVSVFPVTKEVEASYMKNTSSIEVVADPTTASTILHG